MTQRTALTRHELAQSKLTKDGLFDAAGINEKLPKLQELIMSGAQPCRVICAQALLQCHRLLDDAEANMDEAIANAKTHQNKYIMESG